MLFLKLLKIALPVATVTSATIATTLLVSSSSDVSNEKNTDIDKELNDFQKPSEDFKDKKIYYAEGGNSDGLTSLGNDMPPSLLEALEKQDENVPPLEGSIDKETLEKLKSNPDLKVADQAVLGGSDQEQNKEMSLPAIQADSSVDSKDPVIKVPDSKADNLGGGVETSGDLETTNQRNDEDGGTPLEGPKPSQNEVRSDLEDGNPSSAQVAEVEDQVSDREELPSGDGQDLVTQGDRAEQESNPQDTKISESADGEADSAFTSSLEESAKSESSQGGAKMSEEQLKKLEDLRDEVSRFKDQLQDLVGLFD